MTFDKHQRRKRILFKVDPVVLLHFCAWENSSSLVIWPGCKEQDSVLFELQLVNKSQIYFLQMLQHFTIVIRIIALNNYKRIHFNQS